MNTNTQRKNYVIALLIGALAVPLLALAANGLITSDGSADQAGDAANVAPLSLVSGSIEKVVDATDPGEDHLGEACGEDGQELVEKELDGSIEPLEQAALDALRPICDEAGMALPGAPVPAPTVQQVVVVEQPASNPASDDAIRPDDEKEHEDKEDEEHHEDEEDEKDDD